MKVAAIQLGHNATVALAEQGVILGVLSQEKCDNQKNSSSFPMDALSGLLNEVGWLKSDIEYLVIAGNVVYPPEAYAYLYDSKNRIVDKSPLFRLVKTLRHGILGKLVPQIFTFLKAVRARHLAKKGLNDLADKLAQFGLDQIPREHVEHHLCHARCAYHSLKGTDEKPTLIFTLDGAGDDTCATVSVADKGEFQLLAQTPISCSLGNVYSSTTRFLGMKVLEHEYKVMGLAPYANDTYMRDLYDRIFKPAIWLSKDDPLTFESIIDTSKFYDYLVDNAVGERFDNIAAALQYRTEELVTQWIRNGISQTGIKRICTGGGVFMNVKLNRRIQEMPEVEKAFFMPSCGDESNAIGASYDFFIRNGYKTRQLENLYLGISFNESTIMQVLEEKNLGDSYDISKSDDIELQIAELLAQREIVARFSGRCEWGARSLGNRAILGHPSYMESFYEINDHIKSRDFWMPFAPSILDTAAHQYLQDYNPKRVSAEFMITAFAATDLALHHLRAALHQGDHTLRPQVLEQSTNPKYYHLLKCFEELTGVGGVLNTSFNLHGYPLVATPEQALITLEKSNLKYLALGNFLLSKRAH